jgi:hypothetical protein
MNICHTANVATKRLLIATICLLACLLWQPDLNAQTLEGPGSSSSTGYVSREEALALLEAGVHQANEQLPGLEPTSSLYENTLRRVIYYKAIMREMRNGMPISKAMETTLNEAASLGGLKEVAYTPKVVLRALYEEVRLQLSE